MNTLIQVIGIPLLLGLGLVFFLFVSWASHRRKAAATSEQNEPSENGEKQPGAPDPTDDG